MIRRFAFAVALMLAACSANPAPAATVLYLKNVVGKVVTGGTYTKITLDNCVRCVVNGATVLALPPATAGDIAVRVINSPDVRIEGLTVTGQPAVVGVAATAPGPAGLVIGLPGGEGIRIWNSPRAVVTGNKVTFFHQGITFSGDDVTIDHNTVTHVRTTPIAGSPGKNTKITFNVMTGSYPWRWGQTPAGDHGDAIHVYGTGAVKVVPGLVITDNVFDQADGAAILGIFVQSKGNVYPDADISRNRVKNGNNQGITLNQVSGVVADNVFVSTVVGKKSPALLINGPLPGKLVVSGTKGGPVAPNPKLTAADRALLTILP